MPIVVHLEGCHAQALAAQSTAVAHGTWIHLRSLKVLPGWGVSTRRMWKTGGNRKLSWVMRKNSSALILLYLKSIWPSYKIGGCSYSAKRVNQGNLTARCVRTCIPGWALLQCTTTAFLQCWETDTSRPFLVCKSRKKSLTGRIDYNRLQTEVNQHSSWKAHEITKDTETSP